MAEYIKALRCVSCKKEYSVHEIEYTCPDCGPVMGTLDVLYDFRTVKKYLSKEKLARSAEYSHWRYLPLLPVLNPGFIQPLKTGWTPLYHMADFNRKLGLPNLYLKDDSGNITHSYKDRASSVAIVKALEKGYSAIAAASSGNAPLPSPPLPPARQCPVIFLFRQASRRLSWPSLEPIMRMLF